MLYKKPSFQVPATNGGGSCEKGHAMPDQRGRCIRCGEKVAEMCADEARRLEARNAHFIAHKRAQANHTECSGCGANFA